MNFVLERRLRTKNLEWFLIFNRTKNFDASLVINDKERSNDFSVSSDSKKRKEKGPKGVTDEHMRIILFVNDKKIYKKFEEDVYSFYHWLLHNLTIEHWLDVHEVKDPYKATKDYLKKQGVDDKLLNFYDNTNNPAFYHLSQD